MYTLIQYTVRDLGLDNALIMNQPESKHVKQQI